MADSHVYGAVPAQDEGIDVAHAHEEHEHVPGISRAAIVEMVSEILGDA